MSEAMKLSSRMRSAMVGVVYSYEKAIADLENGELAHVVAHRWRNYGSADGCKLCVAAEFEVGEDKKCTICPLKLMRNGLKFTRDDGLPDFACCTRSLDNLADVVDHILTDLPSDTKKLKRKFINKLKARLKDINEAIDKAGWEVK